MLVLKRKINESKSESKKEFIKKRIDGKGKGSYYAMPVRDKLNILIKYGDFDSEKGYTISNMAKTVLKKNPNKKSTFTHGEITDMDFQKVNIPKLLDYLCKNLSEKEANEIFYTWIISYGELIASKEFDANNRL